jgi:hypothetical protein
MGDLSGFAGAFAGLNCPISYEFSCFEALPVLPFENNYKNCLYLGHIAELEKKKLYVPGF